MRPTLQRLKQTHGRAGQPPLPAAYDPYPEQDDDDVTTVADAADLVCQPVDGDRTSLQLALMDAMSGATTWRT